MARLSPLTEHTPAVLTTVAWLGGITAFIAAWMALFQDDLKRVLAYSTVSQLGYLFMALGAGAVKDMMVVAVIAAMFHLVTHAFFKALLFLAAGNVMHAMGDVIDMRQFSGLKRILPRTNILFMIGAAALAGVFPFAGFFSKDGILAVLNQASRDINHGGQFQVLLIIGFATALMTAIYTSRAYFRTFWGTEKVPEEAGHHAHEASNFMIAPMCVLAVGAVIVGVALGPTHWIANYIQQTPVLESHSEHHEEIWVMVASAILSLVGIGIGYWLSLRAPSVATSGFAVAFADFGRNRLYIDWLYSKLIVAPLEWFAGILGWFDNNVVDWAAMNIASLPRLFGLLGQRVQTGRLPSYTYLTAIGIAAVAVWIATR